MINKPTSQELIKLSNEEITNENEKVKSRFTVIMATSKRAKQLIEEHNEEVENCINPLSVAVKEFADRKVKIVKEREV